MGVKGAERRGKARVVETVEKYGVDLLVPLSGAMGHEGRTGRMRSTEVRSMDVRSVTLRC